MAIFTSISLEEAREVAAAHGIALPDVVEPIPAGSVNSNFFLISRGHRWFLRIYEEQGPEGVAYEWTLLDHLARAGLPVPRRIRGPAPGEISISGKPIAIFELIGGAMSCQAAVTASRAEAVGRILAEAHRATDTFGHRREGRFTLADVERRLLSVDLGAHPELGEPVSRLRDTLETVRTEWPPDLPLGVVHGDLFRDNVHFEGDRIVAVIDWESASDGALVYDLAVTLLAWCWGDDLDWDLARALAHGYAEVRPPSPDEQLALRLACLAAATRFATTRITDFYLREGIGERVYKDYRRFLERLEAIATLDAAELATALFT